MAVSSTNLDIDSIVTDLMALEKRPLTILDNKEASYQSQISAFGTVKSALSSLQSAIQTLSKASTFTARGITSTDIGVIGGSATTSAVPGSYAITVDQIAKNHSVRSDAAYTSTSDTLNHGTLSIKVGTANAVDIEINATNNSLTGVRNAINNSGAGVTASIVNDGTNQRLVLTSKTLGTKGEIAVTATDSGSGGTFGLNGLDSTALVELQGADDAELTVNGLSVTRSSNSISDVVEGLTLTLGKEGSSTVTVSKDTSTVVNAVTAFVTAYNAVVAQNKTLTSYDATSEVASILAGDSTMRSIQTKMASLTQSGVSGLTGGLSRMSDVGISLQRDGTLQLNTTKLTQALNDPNKDVGALFTQTTSGNKGIAVQFNDWINQAVTTNGLLDSRISSLNNSVDALDDRRIAINDRLVLIEARYRKQFSALDALISSMNQTSSFLEQQLASLPGTSKSK